MTGRVILAVVAALIVAGVVAFAVQRRVEIDPDSAKTFPGFVGLCLAEWLLAGLMGLAALLVFAAVLYRLAHLRGL